MAYSLGEAARAAGVSKTSIRRSIDSGRISATKDPFGRWLIEPVELHRVYPPARTETPSAAQPILPLEASVANALEREVTLLREMLEHERAAAEAALARERDVGRMLEAERDRWREQADAWRQQATALLPAPTEAPASEESPRRPWWRW